MPLPGRIRRFAHWVGVIVGTTFVALMVWALIRGGALSFAPLPGKQEERLDLVLAHLNHLEHRLKQHHAAAGMQKIFPEGACFLLTLYGLSWANAAQQTAAREVRERALAELRWTLDEQGKPYVVEPFTDTQVRRGVFWMGQRNLLLGRYLEQEAEARRPPALVREFHENSRALAEAFLERPSRHLESYPDMCWPADNVTALVSLLVHDRLYKTDFSIAYRAWRDWTRDHGDSMTGLPAGRLDGEQGRPAEPARGCANSWIIGVLGAEDPDFVAELYARYVKYFAVRRLGFTMLREYPEGRALQADVDSGPIIWGAGVTATGIGLAAARAAGDMGLATDIYNLASLFGWPRMRREAGRGEQRDYLFGMLPMGDAFLAWGLSVPEPARAMTMTGTPTRWDKVKGRWSFLLVLAGVLGALAAREAIAFRRLKRRRKTEEKGPTDAESPETCDP